MVNPSLQASWEGKAPEEILKDIADDVLDYVSWYTNCGSHIPDDFSNDPDGWTEVLRAIGVAFDIIIREQEISHTKYQSVLKKRGMNLFYKYIEHLWR